MLRRFLLCWACVGVLTLFVFCSVALNIAISFDESREVGALQIGTAFFLLIAVFGAIYAPLVWAIGDSLYCAFRRSHSRYVRYGIAIIFGLVGGFALFYELRHQLPTLERMGWATGLLNQFLEASLVSLSDAERFSQGGGLSLLMLLIANLTCVTSAAAPLAATYISERRLQSQPRGVQP